MEFILPNPNLALSMPKDCLGNVLGEVNTRRGFILKVEYGEVEASVEVNLPAEQIPSFKEWFSKTTNEEGKLISL
jgi:translation elongation factor EF-G